MSRNKRKKSPPALTPEPLDSLSGELLAEGVPKEALEKVMVTVSRLWSGPLPPPEVFRQYPPEVQKAIVAQANSQIKHRQSIENKVIDSNISNSKIGMKFAFAITVALIVTGTVLIIIGKSTAGLVAIFGPTAFHGGNYLIQKWQEWRKIGTDVAQENNKAVSKSDHE